MTPRQSHLWRHYGIKESEYNALLDKQNGGCAICGNLPKTRSLAVDHEHVKGFRHLPPEEKRKYFRGITCFTCNWIMLSRGVCLPKAKKLVEYLEAYEQRKATYT